MSGFEESHEPKQLIGLLVEQRDLYRRLRQLSEQQRTLITGDRPEMLLNILRERQTLVGALSRLNEQLAPFRRNWEPLYAGLRAELRNEANELLQEINSLLRVILRTDQEDSALLSARKQSVAREMDALSGAQSANTAYAPKTPAGNSAHSADMHG
jgi:hypothetical protein